VLNSVFLHEAIEAGLDSAIVNASKIEPLVPVDVVVDHSVEIDVYNAPDAVQDEYRQNQAKDSAKADKASRGVDDKGPDFGPAVTLSGAFANVQPTGQAEKTQPYKPGSISSISA